MNYIFSLLPINSLNWKISNINNIYNFIYLWMKKIDSSKRKEYIDDLKLIIGLSFSASFKEYLIKKFPNDIEIYKDL